MHFTRVLNTAVRRLPLGLLATAAIAAASPAGATVVFTSTFTNATTGHVVNVEADLTISGNLLTVVLTNTEYLADGVTATDSSDPTEILSGFFFDIIGRPVLTYSSATGTLLAYPGPTVTANANILACNVQVSCKTPTVAGGWAFSGGFDNTVGYQQTYGLGTSGYSNNASTGYTFPGAATNGGNGQLDYSIASGTPTNGNVTNHSPLVQNSALFTLAGVAGYTEAQIGNSAVFGFGTAPDAVTTSTKTTSSPPPSGDVPEPLSLALIASGLATLGLARRRALRA